MEATEVFVALVRDRQRFDVDEGRRRAPGEASLQGGGRLLFGFGSPLAFTPCVLPMIPIL
jgi:thiol:disulfide interchange protein